MGGELSLPHQELSLCCLPWTEVFLSCFTSLPPKNPTKKISVPSPASMRELRAPPLSSSPWCLSVTPHSQPSPQLGLEGGTQTALQSFIESLVASHLFSYSPGKSQGNFPGTTGLHFEAVPSNNTVMDTKLACLRLAYFPCRTTAGVARMAQDSLWGISFLGQRSVEYFFSFLTQTHKHIDIEELICVF